MKYYSEILNKNFDTVENLEAAEKAEKEKVLAKAKEDAARTEEINAAKEVVKRAKEDYEVALKVCREAMDRWSAAEGELIAAEKKNRSTAGSPQTYDDFKKLAERWGLADWSFF